jgi:hypothetical protein
MEDRIYFGGKWYVAEQTKVQPVVKTVDWMISRLQELSEAGYGNCEMTFDIDYGNDYIAISEVELTLNGRVHIS